jgi:putative oxidoreductase
MPGIGLAILRLAVSSFLSRECLAIFAVAVDVKSAIPAIIAAGLGILLLLGLWTPVAGPLVALFQLWITIADRAQLWESALAVAIATGLSLVGPGSWSIDARAYGRKRIYIRKR